jgi:hypothetical protein
MTSFLDEIAPEFVGEDRISLSLADANTAPKAFAPFTVLVDYGRCLPEGVVLPL